MAPRRSSLSPAKKALEKINKVRSEQRQQRQQRQNDQGEQENGFSGTDVPELAILRISEPIVALSSDLFDNSNNGSGNEPLSKRASDASSSAAEALDAPTTPASLEADLTHYKVRAFIRALYKLIMVAEFSPPRYWVSSLGFISLFLYFSLSMRCGRGYALLTCYRLPSIIFVGTFFQTPILIPRTGHERKVSARNCRRPANGRRT
jgi:hypothetical protein